MKSVDMPIWWIWKEDTEEFIEMFYELEPAIEYLGTKAGDGQYRIELHDVLDYKDQYRAAIEVSKTGGLVEILW